MIIDKRKLHIGAGDIYLEPDYINIDIKGKLVSEISIEELEKNTTTLIHYFKYPFGSLRREVIIDKKMDILKPWDFENNSIDEIVAISIIEHFTPIECKFIVSEIKRVLSINGVLIIDFPDIKNTVTQYINKDPDFAMRLIYCNWKDNFSCHKYGYTDKTFRDLWDKNFSVYEEIIVKHEYPMHSYVVIKNA